jgi:hypothetical protein
MLSSIQQFRRNSRAIRIQRIYRGKKTWGKVIFIINISSLNITWRYKFLKVIYHLTKFIKQLKTYASKFKYRLLTRKIIKLIGDSAGDEDEIMLYNKLANQQISVFIIYFKT